MSAATTPRGRPTTVPANELFKLVNWKTKVGEKDWTAPRGRPTAFPAVGKQFEFSASQNSSFKIAKKFFWNFGTVL